MANPNWITCGHCGVAVFANSMGSAAGVHYLQCPNCKDGSVRVKSGAVHPPAPAGAPVPGLPDEVEGAWREARSTFAVAAYTASEMMCRKILMHLAVDVAQASAGKRFVEYVDALDGAGYITTGLKPVIDSIRDRGNTANHEIPASSESDAHATIAVTEHLLRAIYELPKVGVTDDDA